MTPIIRTLVALSLVVGLAFTLGVDAEPPKPAAPAEKSAKEAADFLLSLSPTNADVGDIPALIKQLGDDDFEKREAANKVLRTLGPLAIPALEAARRNRDAEIVRQAARCYEAIVEVWSHYDRVWTALRVLRERSDEAAITAILAILPVVAPDMELDDFTWLTLEKVVGTKPENLRVLEPYLKDRMAARRAAAACLLARYGDAKQQDTAKGSLKDGSAEVRLRTAQGLLGAGETAGIATLIELLDAEPLPLAWQAEELLIWWSDGQGPLERIGAGKAEDRRACQTAWRAWKPPVGKIAPARRFCRPPGLFLAYCETRSTHPCRLAVLGCDGAPHWWRASESRELFDLHMLASGNTLLYEAPIQEVIDAEGKPLLRVVEHQPDGGMVWGLPRRASDAHISSGYWYCRRLIWGGTFVSGYPGRIQVIGPDNEDYRNSGEEQTQIVQYYPWQLLPDGLGVRLSTGIPFGVKRALCYKLPHASVGMGRDREIRVDVPEVLGPNGSLLRLKILDSGRWNLTNATMGKALEMDDQSEVKYTVTVPGGCETMVATEDGYLCTVSDRLWEVDRNGKPIWESWWGDPHRDKKQFWIRWPVDPIRRVRPCFRKVSVGIRPDRRPIERVEAYRRDCLLMARQPGVRAGAVRELGNLKSLEPATGDAILKVLTDESVIVREFAFEAVAKLKIGTVANLGPLMRHELMDVRRRVVFALLGVEKDRNVVLPFLLRALSDPSPEVRQTAAWSSTSGGFDPDVLVQVLVRMVESDKGLCPGRGPVWLSALHGLAEIGPRTELAESVIHRMRSDNKTTTEYGGFIAENLVKISQSEAALEAISDILQNEMLSELNRLRTILALERFGTRARRFVPLLQKSAKEAPLGSTLNVKMAALKAIKTILGSDVPPDH